MSRVWAWLYGGARTLQAFLRQSQALGQKRPRTLILAHGRLEGVMVSISVVTKLLSVFSLVPMGDTELYPSLPLQSFED